MLEITRAPAQSKCPVWVVRHRRVLLASLIVVTVLAAGVLLLRRPIYSLLFLHFHVVAGQAGMAHLHLPPGFQMRVYYAGLASLRLLTFRPEGAVFIAEHGTGSIVAWFGRGFRDRLFENAGNALGHPVGVALGPDWAPSVSEDKGGVIYRITCAD